MNQNHFTPTQNNAQKPVSTFNPGLDLQSLSQTYKNVNTTISVVVGGILLFASIFGSSVSLIIGLILVPLLLFSGTIISKLIFAFGHMILLLECINNKMTISNNSDEELPEL